MTESVAPGGETDLGRMLRSLTVSRRSGRFTMVTRPHDEPPVGLGDGVIEMASLSEDRLCALRQVPEEKLVKRKVSLKVLDYGRGEAASGGTVRQTATLQAGINADKARELNKHIKGLGLKGVQSQTQGDQVRVTGKKRDDLQAVIASLKEADLELPLQFQNFRD